MTVIGASLRRGARPRGTDRAPAQPPPATGGGAAHPRPQAPSRASAVRCALDRAGSTLSYASSPRSRFPCPFDGDGGLRADSARDCVDIDGSRRGSAREHCPRGTTASGGLCVGSGPTASQAAEMVRSTFQDASLGAVVVGIWSNDKPVLVGALGESMTGVPASVDMHHRTGNITATMLTTALLQQVDKRKLSMSDSFSKWIRTCRRPTPSPSTCWRTARRATSITRSSTRSRRPCTKTRSSLGTPTTSSPTASPEVRSSRLGRTGSSPTRGWSSSPRSWRRRPVDLSPN